MDLQRRRTEGWGLIPNMKPGDADKALVASTDVP